MTDAFDLPKLPGAYALLIQLSRPLSLPIARLRRPTLAAGHYVYCGSAHGAGGMAARVGRHLRRDKIIRWHVDYLTRVGQVLDVLCVPDGSECDLVRRISQVPGMGMPVAGLGSSDCRQCTTHLLSAPTEFVLTV